MLTIKPNKEWTEKEKETLLRRAKSGDQTVVNDLIDAYIPIAMKSAAWYVRRLPDKFDDVFGAGLEGLVIACHRVCNGHLKDDNVEQYIKSIVRWSIRDFVRKDVLIPIPHKEFKKRIEKWIESGEEHPNTPINDLELRPNNSMAFTDTLAIIVSLDKIRENLERDLQHTDEAIGAIDDIFQRLNLTEREAEIVSLRMADYTLQEIGDRFGLTKMAIKYILDDVRIKMAKAGLKPRVYTQLTGTKVCTKCQKEKSLSEFYKRSDNHGETHKSICKQCMKEKRDATTSDN